MRKAREKSHSLHFVSLPRCSGRRLRTIASREEAAVLFIRHGHETKFVLPKQRTAKPENQWARNNKGKKGTLGSLGDMH